jgi:CubicO group peptidase (beta-lactamase class C family)
VILLLAAGFFAQLRVAIAACGFLLPARHKRRMRAKTKGTHPMPSLADYVDSVLSKLVTPETPGCALAIVDRGEVVHSRGYGLADLELRAPITPTIQFPLASASKQFTAICVALLASEGKLTLDDDVRAHVPELPAYERAITIRHLIHHTSGLRECLTLWALIGRDMMRLEPHQDVLDILARQRGLNFAPGEEYEYSNTNYFLLALIVERVSVQALDVLMSERIFAPLGMPNSAFHDHPAANAGRRACGYILTVDGYTRAPEGIGARGAAGVFSTIEDLVRWDQNFYQPSVGDAALITQLLTPGRIASGRPIHYAFGLFVQNYADFPVVSHAGMFAGFSAQLMRFPEQQFSVICLANNPAINPSAIAFQIAEQYFDRSLRTQSTTVGKQPNADLHAFTGTFHDQRSGRVCDVFVEGEQLVVQLKDERLVLVPLSVNQFHVVDALDSITITFETASDRIPLTMHLIVEGEAAATFVAVDRMSPTPDELEAFTGSYFSAELDVTFEFLRRGDQLIFGGLNLPLEPTIRDCFRSDLDMHFEFFRDASDQIAGFTFFCGGANHIRFVRAGYPG